MLTRSLAIALVTTVLLGWSGSASAQALVLPTPEEAKGAVMRMFDDPQMTKMMATGRVVIGTCKPASKAAHEGEIACTLAVVMGAGSSETQANFYRSGGQWTATPTTETLPFPDPKLIAH